MTPVATSPFPPTTTSRRELLPGFAVGLVTALVVVVLFLPRLDTAPHVDEVTFENPNSAETDVDIGSGGAWVGIGPIEAEDSETVEDVYDPGDRWRFRVTVPGQEPVVVEMSRAELEATDWAVQLPATGG